MIHQNKEGFESLDQWLDGSGEKYIGAIRGWWAAGRLAASPSWLRNKESWRSHPRMWNAYLFLCKTRAETQRKSDSLNTMIDPFRIGNEIMGIGCIGAYPVAEACRGLLTARCSADYAPEPNLPTVREILLNWTEWFDCEYNRCEDHRTGELMSKHACAIAAETLAKMEALAIGEASAKVKYCRVANNQRL